MCGVLVAERLCRLFDFVRETVSCVLRECAGAATGERRCGLEGVLWPWVCGPGHGLGHGRGGSRGGGAPVELQLATEAAWRRGRAASCIEK